MISRRTSAMSSALISLRLEMLLHALQGECGRAWQSLGSVLRGEAACSCSGCWAVVVLALSRCRGGCLLAV